MSAAAGVGSVAVLGAGGIMGLPIARNLARAGFEVRAWNRSPDKAERLAADGVILADTPAEAADGADAVLTMLADADAVLAATDGEHGALSAPHLPRVWLQMSTIGEAGTDSCAELARRREIVLVDAPVLGTRQPADKGKAMTERNFDPSFSLTMAAKDAGLVADAAARSGLELPVVDAVRQRLEQGAREHGAKDFSATYLTSAPART